MVFQLTLMQVPATWIKVEALPDEPSVWTIESHGSLQDRQVTLATDSYINAPSEYLCVSFSGNTFWRKLSMPEAFFRSSL